MSNKNSIYLSRYVTIRMYAFSSAASKSNINTYIKYNNQYMYVRNRINLNIHMYTSYVFISVCMRAYCASLSKNCEMWLKRE